MPIVCCVYYYRSFEVKTNSTKLTAFVVRVFKIFSSRLPMQLSDQDSIILSVDLAGNIYPAACCGCLLALLGAPDSQTSFQLPLFQGMRRRAPERQKSGWKSKVAFGLLGASCSPGLDHGGVLQDHCLCDLLICRPYPLLV